MKLNSIEQIDFGFVFFPLCRLRWGAVPIRARPRWRADHFENNADELAVWPAHVIDSAIIVVVIATAACVAHCGVQFDIAFSACCAFAAIREVRSARTWRRRCGARTLLMRFFALATHSHIKYIE